MLPLADLLMSRRLLLPYAAIMLTPFSAAARYFDADCRLLAPLFRALLIRHYAEMLAACFAAARCRCC